MVTSLQVSDARCTASYVFCYDLDVSWNASSCIFVCDCISVLVHMGEVQELLGSLPLRKCGPLQTRSLQKDINPPGPTMRWRWGHYVQDDLGRRVLSRRTRQCLMSTTSVARHGPVGSNTESESMSVSLGPNRRHQELQFVTATTTSASRI